MSKNKNAEIVFKFTDFAGIDTCSISLTQLTVIAGPNSAGKTYVVYAIYSLLKNLGNFLSVPLPVAILQRLISTGSAELDLSETATHDYSKGVSANFMRNLPFYFSVNEDFFSKAKVEITIPKIKFFIIFRIEC